MISILIKNLASFCNLPLDDLYFLKCICEHNIFLFFMHLKVVSCWLIRHNLVCLFIYSIKIKYKYKYQYRMLNPKYE